MATTIHVGIAKWLLLELLAKHGAAEVARDWKGTDDELAAAIRRDPREVFVLDPSCDRQGPDGACQGHGTAPPATATPGPGEAQEGRG